MAKKVLLIAPPRTGNWNSAIFSVCEPLGLAYLAAVLEKNNFEAEILDCFILGKDNKTQSGDFVRIGLTNDEIRNYIKKSGVDIIGITNMFTSLATDSLEVARIAKEVNPESLVVMGGAHATLACDSILKDKNVDMVVLGEGEETFLEVVRNFYEKKSVSDIRGAVIRVNGQIKYNPDRPLIHNLDDTPYPARHLLPMKLYFKDQEKTTFGLAMRLPVATMITSRGCPYRCIFCSTTKVWKKWRFRSAKNVVDEIEVLIRDYGVKEIAFEDDNFIVEKQRITDICDEILKRRINIKWTVPAGISVWIIDEKTLIKMKKAGFYRVCFALESGSEETLKFIRKPVDLKKARKMINFSNRIGLWTSGNFIFGFPDERPESVNQTFSYARQSGLDMAVFYIAQPFAGSDLYTMYEKMGLLKFDGGDKSSLVDTIYDTAYYSASELTRLRGKASRQYIIRRIFFYLTPYGLFFNLLPKINSLENFRHFFKIIRVMMPNPKILLKLPKNEKS